MINNLSFEYIDKHSSKCVVFLHGWGMNGEAFNKIISKLNNDNSIVKIDLFGFGKSSPPKDYFDTYEYAYQIFLLLKKLKIEDVILVGHSFGGRLAILLSSVFNLKVESLFLCASAGLNKFSFVKWVRLKRYKFLKWCVNAGLVNKNILLKFGSKDYRNASQELKRVMNNVVSQDLRKWLKKITVKTYLIWDKKDTETKFWMCKIFNKLICKSMIVVYKTGGHFAIFVNTNKFAELLNKI